MSIEVKFPPKGTLDHPAFRQADRHALLSDVALARGIRGLPVESDPRQNAGRSRDHPHLGSIRRQDAGRFLFVPRSAWAAAARADPGPTAPTSSTSCRTRATCQPSSPKPAIRFWSSNWVSSRIPAVPGFRRGGFGYDKRIRTLDGGAFISNADRSILGCYGVNGGQGWAILRGRCYGPDGDNSRSSWHVRHGHGCRRVRVFESSRREAEAGAIRCCARSTESSTTFNVVLSHRRAHETITGLCS